MSDRNSSTKVFPSTMSKSISCPQIRPQPLLHSARSTVSANQNFIAGEDDQNQGDGRSSENQLIKEKIERHVHFSDTLSPAVCRICHGGEASCPFSDGEPLISACHCSGSMGMYHRRCLETWLSTSNRDKCEICKFQYVVERRPKPLSEFFRNPGDRSIHRNMLGDTICLVILTPMALASSWLCIAGAVAVAESGNDGIAVPGLISLALFLVMTYFIWLLVSIRYHFQVWKDWRRHNHCVRLLNDIDNHQLRPKSPPLMDNDQIDFLQEQLQLQPLNGVPSRRSIDGNSAESHWPTSLYRTSSPIDSYHYTNLAFSWETMV